MLKLDIRDFQAWSAEFRDFPYSEREVLHAFKQLKQLELIGVAKTEVTIRAKHWDSPNTNGQQAWGLTTRNLYLKSGLAILLATLLVGTFKLIPIPNTSPSLKTQLQNFKIPNPWNNSNKKS